MRHLLSIAVLILALMGCGKKASVSWPIIRPVLGDEMQITGVQFEANRNCMLRVEGHWKGDFPLDRYDVKATVSPFPEGPASGSMYWYVGLAKSKDAAGKGFSLEFQNPLAFSDTLHVQVYFADKQDGYKVVDQIGFEIPNPAKAVPLGLSASEMPATVTDRDLSVALEDLKTGKNFAPPDKPPAWYSKAQFRLSENGKPADGWRLLRLHVTPNIGFPFTNDYGINPPEDGVVKASILGTLWKEAGPYRIDLSLFRVEGIPVEDHYALAQVVVPQPGAVTPIDRSWQAKGIKITFGGMYGVGAMLPKEVGGGKADFPTLVFTIAADPDVWMIEGVTDPQELPMGELRRGTQTGTPSSYGFPRVTAGQVLDLHFAAVREKRDVSFTVNSR